MTGAAPAVAPAAPAAGNATLLSATGGDTSTVTPDAQPPVTPEKPPADQPLPEGDTPDTPATEPEPAEEDGPPESYDFKAPEGITLDPVAVEAFAPVAKDLGLTQAQAQRVVDLYAGLQAQQAETQAAQVKAWAKAVTTDKEIGGAKWAENRALIAQARDKFASPELVSLMEQTGLGSHPEIIKLFVKVGKAIADDGHVTGGGSPTQPTDFATDYYARMPKLERTR
jgi:hypothetical protein